MLLLIKELYDTVNLILNDKIVRTITICVTIFCILLLLFYSFLAAVIIYISYISGFIVSWLLVKYQNKAGFYLKQISIIYKEHLQAKKKFINSCSICDDLSCKRHKKCKSITPWKHLFINKNLNSAIEHFYEKIIENFITQWYRQFTTDNDFSNELRYCLRYSTATLINRFLELDIGDVISKKLLPCAVKHIDDYLYIQQIGKLKNIRFNEVCVEYLGKRLHAASTNRKNELSYLQHLVSLLMGHVLPEDYLQCRNYIVVIREILAGWVLLPLMDVLADPNIINYLVILATTYKSKKYPKVSGSEETVEFLVNFNSKENEKESSFTTNLNKIRNDMNLLYAFIQFLKKQDHVNLLQFCLDVDDFNLKLLNPDLSKKQVEELNVDALKLYRDYLDKTSYNFISCPSDILKEFDFLIEEYQDYCSVEKLTNLSKLLYKAYEHTFNTLENMWLPKFFHSSEFYAHICGSRILPTYSKQLASKQKKIEFISQGAVSKLSSGLGKIKGALKANQPVDGAFFPGETPCVDRGTVDDILLSECKPLFRDLSTWRVWISISQASSNKIVHFCVNVERTDVPMEDSRRKWTVWRKDQDFYTLKAKLVEFHGESEICDSPLPARKAGSFVEARVTKYEEFLRKLLQKSTLKGSDLLYAFLTVEEDFTLYIATNASNMQDFGNIYQSMAYKLRKEKGQHLDSFMEAFLKSTGVLKNEKEWAEVGEAVDLLNVTCNVPLILPKTYQNRIFNDNFGIQYRSLKETMSGSFNPECFTKCFFYLLRYIFKIPNGFLKLYASICSIGEHLVETIFKVMVEHKLKSALCQVNLTYLVKQLESVIFTPHVSPTKEELDKRRRRAFELLDEAFPSLLIKIFDKKIKGGASTILEILQNPHYNKHFAYNLLDIVLTEMFPILNTKEEHYSLE